MIITIYSDDNVIMGVADSRKLQRVNIVNGKLLFIFDNNLVSILEFDHYPSGELRKIVNGLKSLETDVELYGVISRQFTTVDELHKI